MVRWPFPRRRARVDYLAPGVPEQQPETAGARPGSLASVESSEEALSPELSVREAVLEREAARRKAEAAPIVADLQAIGFDHDDLWRLDRESGSMDLDAARSVLLRHLFAPERPAEVGEPIARALARLGFSDAVWEQLARRYRAGVQKNEAEGLADALVTNAARRRVPELVEMVRDPSLGPSRVLLLAPVSRRLAGHGDALLEEFLDDPVLGLEAKEVLHRRAVARQARARRAHRNP